MKVAICQIKTTAGEVEANLVRARDAVLAAARQGADLAVLPEYCVSGWDPFELLRDERFIAAHDAALRRAPRWARVPTIIGHLEWDEESSGYVGAASLLQDGRIADTVLEAYDAPHTLEVGDSQVAVVFGSTRAAVEEADLVVHLTDMHFWPGWRVPHELSWSSEAARLGAPVVVVNPVGGNGTRVFPGLSCAFNAAGMKVAEAAGFAEQTLIADLDAAGKEPSLGSGDEIPELWEALKLGLHDYVRKAGFEDACLGLSGGVDSAVVAALAAEALGREHVVALGMPSAYSSEKTRAGAAAAAANLGVRYLVLPIDELRSGYEDILRPVLGDGPPGLAEQNVQARIRGTLVMAYSNKLGAFPLACGNRSEAAMGYCTLYGDTAGGLAPLGEIPKTVVYQLAAHANRNREVIPHSVIEQPPSAELAPGQRDQDDLPPYEVLDAMLQLYLDEGCSREDVLDAGFDPDLVDRVLGRLRWAAFKRGQCPPALRVYSPFSPWPELPAGI
jgi:NAD+ synthase (glutamine-hydrolysing)